MISIFSHLFKKKDDQDKGETTKKIEVSSDQAKAVKRLLENFQELDEEELIAFIENDPVLAKLPLKKRYEILESAKEYQQKLENPESEETEKQEKKEQEGRDPEQFLKEVFDWTEVNQSPWNDRSSWKWEIGKNEDNIQYINMKINASDLPTSFIDKNKEISDFEADLSTKGIEKLLKELQGKRIISIKEKSDKNWYLEIV